MMSTLAEPEREFALQEEFVSLRMIESGSCSSSCRSSDMSSFLRGLILNCCDAMQKLDVPPKLFIRFIPDKATKTLTIILDSGIGMTHADLVNSLAAVTVTTKELSAGAADFSSIGQFAAGFHSVAEKVIVTTKHNDDQQLVLESQAPGKFTVARDESGQKLGRGTKITLYLKEDHLEYLEERTLKGLVEMHRNDINYPLLFLSVEKKDISDHGEEEEEEVRKRKKLQPLPCLNGKVGGWLPPWLMKKHEEKMKKKADREHDLENKLGSFCMRKPDDEITKEEYADLYKSMPTYCGKEHVAMKHFSVEGRPEFQAILFVPSHREEGEIYVYLRHGLVMDDDDLCEELIPDYLRFVDGIVVSSNISPEMLEQNKVLKVIRENLENKCLELFFEIAENKEQYDKFYRDFSKVLREGIKEASDKSKIAELLRYYSTRSDDELTSLNDYVARMKQGQKDIYYIIGESIKAVQNSPLLEKLNKMGYEVLYMVDNIDEDVIPLLTEFKGKKLVSASKEGLKLAEESSNEEEKKKEKYEGLCKVFKDVLGNSVEKVTISDRLVDSPCCLVTAEDSRTANKARIAMKKIYRESGLVWPISIKITMEINPDNPTIDELRKRADDEDKLDVKELVMQLFETALLTCGFSRHYLPKEFGLSIDKGDSDMPAVEGSDVDTEEGG